MILNYFTFSLSSFDFYLAYSGSDIELEFWTLVFTVKLFPFFFLIYFYFLSTIYFDMPRVLKINETALSLIYFSFVLSFVVFYPFSISPFELTYFLKDFNYFKTNCGSLSVPSSCFDDLPLILGNSYKYISDITFF